MNTNYLRKDNESFLDWKLRLITGKIDKTLDLDWSEIKDLLGLDCHPDHLRKTAYGICEYAKHFEEKLKDGVGSEVVDKINESKRELYKERQKLRDEKNEYNAWLREQSRMELFYERIDEAVEKLMSKKKREIPSIVSVDKNNAKLVVAFADTHYDSNFLIKGFSGEVINEYNKDIFAKRMWTLRDEIVDFANIHNTKELHIVDLGDAIEGILHVSAIASLRENIVDSIMDYADFLEEWLYSLSDRFSIKFYTSEGNHSDLRILTGKKGDFPHENLEKIYTRSLLKAFKNNLNVEIVQSLNGLNYFNVNGYNILTAHGNKENNIKQSIKEYEDTYNISVNYFIVGHLHSKNEIEVSKGKEVIQVRSLMGINDFAKDIKKTSEAGATMFIVHENYGRKYVNEVKLK